VAEPALQSVSCFAERDHVHDRLSAVASNILKLLQIRGISEGYVNQ
jgi:hypothetical protein